MTINENDRLDLRQELERIFKNPRLAEIAMEAMPPIDYHQLATKQDLAALDTKIQGQFARIDGRFAQVEGGFGHVEGRFAQLDGRFAHVEGAMIEMKGELKTDIANNLRMMLAAQVTTMMMLGAWVAAIT